MKNFIKKYFTKENITTLMGLVMAFVQVIGAVNVPSDFIVAYNLVAALLITLGYDKEQIKQIVRVNK